MIEASALESQVNTARQKWYGASERASSIAQEMHQPGTGYGDPEALLQAEHHLNSARFEADRLFRDYDSLERQLTGEKMLALQASQRLATWASFAVALAVGVATVADFVIKLIK
jgi:outer membrane murein-binding lipoprotein Lpp